QLRSRGIRLIDEHPRPGAEGSTIAFIHPSSTHGVLIELKQPAMANQSAIRHSPSAISRFTLGELELISLSDGFLRMDGGLMFGIVPKTEWSAGAPADDRNRVTLGMRPLIVRGARTMIIDAGLGRKGDAAFDDAYGVDHRYDLDRALAEAHLAPEEIE